MEWDNITRLVSPYLVKIETPTGSGTGFLYVCNETKTICGVATAHHVISDTDEWLQPMRIHTNDFKKTAFLKESERIVFSDYKTDSAVILFDPAKLHVPETFIQLRPVDAPLSIGAEVGWLGYPAIEPYTLCFFSGNISARRQDRSAYLVDGVAINGVSGGPVLYSGSSGVQVVGIVTAYHANRQRGDALPGLSVAQDVSHFHQVIQQLKSMDEAVKKRAEIDEAQKTDVEKSASSATSPIPPEE